VILSLESGVVEKYINEANSYLSDLCVCVCVRKSTVLLIA
jgi:hypothetical protein